MTTLDKTVFRAQFTAFADTAAYPDTMLDFQYSMAQCFIADDDQTLPSDCRANALMLMLAHLLTVQSGANAGNFAGTIQSASEGDVSITFAQRTTDSAFRYFLNSTSYGVQLLTMLEIASSGGLYISCNVPRMILSGGF